MNWMKMAFEAAEQSLDPSTKVGAVMVNGPIAVAGWNGFPPGVPGHYWDDRTKKYKHVIHAEMNALIAAKGYTEGSTLFITHHPCRECAKLIVASGVSCVVCPKEPWRDDPSVVETCQDAAEILWVAGVNMCEPGRIQ